MVGVAIDDKVAVRNFVQQFNIRYPVLLGDSSALNVMRAAGNQVGCCRSPWCWTSAARLSPS